MEPIEVAWSDTDVAIVTLVGEHDLATTDALAESLGSLLRAGHQLVVDLSEAEFIDSSVLNALIEADGFARERGSSLVLQLGTTSVVRRAIETSGILRHLRSASSRAEAITAARSKGASANA